MKKLWFLSLLLFGFLAGPACAQLWDLGTSEDWLSAGPIYHTGPYYYPSYYTPVYYYYYYPYYYPSYYAINYPTYSSTYGMYNNPYYYPYYPYNNQDSFPLGTFGQFHGGNYNYGY